jgi:peptidoglycan-associated lipoprotein
MPISRPLRAAVLCLAVGGALAACRRPIRPGATTAASDTTSAVDATAGAGSASDSAGSGGGGTTAPLDDEAVRREAELRNALLAPVYFEFDQADLSDQTRADLEQKAALLRQNAGIAVRIAGHTDARGSDEYNLALGQRRAGIVKRHLMERGIAGARLEIVSFGEERPAAEGDDESARSQNRRAEFEITRGATAAQTSSPSQTSP